MQEKTIELNYPDILGFITDTTRITLNNIQIALAPRPNIIRAGRPFEVLILMQNLTDIAADVSIAVHLPEKDAEGKKGQFLTGKERLVVEILPAEVGYVAMQLSTLPDTAVSKEYTIGFEINIKTSEGKSQHIRDSAGGSPLRLQTLCPDLQQVLMDLKKLRFDTRKSGGLLRGNTFETHISVLAGRVGTPLNLKPEWVSLWTLEDQDNVELLLEKYRGFVRNDLLPKLRSKTVYPPLAEKTAARFEEAGYPLDDIEIKAITKLLTLILEFANVSRTAHDSSSAGIYNIEYRVAEKQIMVDENAPTPHWLNALLRAIAKDERVKNVPIRALPYVAYDDLLYDAMVYSFQQVERFTGEVLGTPEEIEAYIQQFLDKLSHHHALEFADVYMPLMLGGILSYDQVKLPNEKLAETMPELPVLLERHKNEINEDNSLIYKMTSQLIDISLEKHGTLDHGW